MIRPGLFTQLIAAAFIFLVTEHARALPRPPKFVRQLADEVTKAKDPRDRARAVEALAQIGPKAEVAIPALRAALDDDDRLVQARAIEALGRIGPAAKSAIPQLMEFLKPKRNLDDSDARAVVRRQAFLGVTKDALVGIGEPAVPAVAELLVSDVAREQAIGAELLARIGPPAKNALPDLERLFKSSKDPVVRIWTAAASVRAGGEEKAPVEFLRATMMGGKAQLDDMAAKALAEIGPPALPILMEVLTGKNKRAAASAQIGLRRLGPAALDPLSKLLQTKDRAHKRIVVDTIRGMDPDTIKKAIPTLIAELRKGDDDTWEDVGKALAHAESAAVPALLEVVRIDRGPVRLRAVYALNRIIGDD